MSEPDENSSVPTIQERILQTVQQSLNCAQTSAERQDFLAENLADVRLDIKKIVHRQGRVEEAFDRLLASAGRTRGDVISLTGRLEGLIRTVAEQGGRLDSHEAKLDRHELKLDLHTQTLAQHTEALARLEAGIEKILAKLEAA